MNRNNNGGSESAATGAAVEVHPQGELPRTQFWTYTFANMDTIITETDDEKCSRIVLKNCSPATLYTAFRGVHELIQNDPSNPSLTSLQIHLCVEEQHEDEVWHPSHDYELLEQLVAVLSPRLETMMWTSYLPDTLGHGSQLLSVLVDYCVPHCVHLTALKLDGCALDDFAGLKVGDLFRGGQYDGRPQLQSLSMCDCFLKTPAIRFFRTLRRSLAACPPTRRGLVYLDLYLVDVADEEPFFNYLTDITFELVALAGLGPPLRHLAIRNWDSPLWKFGLREIQTLTVALSSPAGVAPGGSLHQLQLLDLSYTDCFQEASPRVVEQFFDTLSNMTFLEKLCLCSTKLPATALIPLTRCLTKCHQLQELDLKVNHALLEQSNVEVLRPFVRLLARLPALQNVKLPRVIDHRFVACLFKDIIEYNSAIKFLEINDESGLRSVPMLLTIDTSWTSCIPRLHLQSLDVMLGPDDVGWSVLFEAVKKNIHLTGHATSAFECMPDPLQSELGLVFKRNQLLLKIRQRRQLQVSPHRQWPVLLDGIANRKHGSVDQTPLFLFLQQNADVIFEDTRRIRKRDQLPK